MPTRNELACKAESLGLKVLKSSSKKDIERIIKFHEDFIKLNEMMKNRPRRGL